MPSFFKSKAMLISQFLEDENSLLTFNMKYKVVTRLNNRSFLFSESKVLDESSN